jgi:MFS family permease
VIDVFVDELNLGAPRFWRGRSEGDRATLVSSVDPLEALCLRLSPVASSLSENVLRAPLSALAYVLVRNAFPEALWPRVFGLLAGVWSVTVLIGPLIGGVFASSTPLSRRATRFSLHSRLARAGSRAGAARPRAPDHPASRLPYPSSGGPDRRPKVSPSPPVTRAREGTSSASMWTGTRVPRNTGFPLMILPFNRSLVGARVERISPARAPEMCPFEKQSKNIKTVRRKLAAIFAADVAGYSRLMARDA